MDLEELKDILPEPLDINATNPPSSYPNSHKIGGVEGAVGAALSEWESKLLSIYLLLTSSLPNLLCRKSEAPRWVRK